MEASKDAEQSTQQGELVVPSIQRDNDCAWFSELSSLWPGQCLSLRIAHKLTHRKSAFQDILVFDSDSPFGRVLVLDGVIQLTEKDESGYQEPLAHLPLCGALNEPRKILVVGGGDGGVLREICRHSCVEQVDLCEIDEEVIKVSKEFFPGLACGFDDPRVTVHIRDGAEFARNTPDSTYDCVIVDSSDPVGPASVLFEKPFLSDLARIVQPGWRLIFLAGS